MKKRLAFVSLLMSVLLCISACTQTDNQTSEEQTPTISTGDESNEISAEQPVNPQNDVYKYNSPVWESVHGGFVRENSGQYDSGVLQMMYLGNSCLMFEFRLMEGSEEDDYSVDTIIPGVLLVDAEGTGHFETNPDAENPFSIDFVISEDGQQVEVTHKGEIEISPDGVYIFTYEDLEVSDMSAISILENLPTAATSLGGAGGAYTVHYPDSLVADWFYPVEATSDINGAVLAKFLIAKDLSAVFRVDDDIEPVLIFGSAQPMMEAEIYIYKEHDEFESSNEDNEIGEWNYEPQPVAYVAFVDGIVMTVSAKNQLVAILPWELSYAIKAESSNPSVATVGESGVVTANEVGEATITGTLTVEDGMKEFSIEISVVDESEKSNESTYMKN